MGRGKFPVHSHEFLRCKRTTVGNTPVATLLECQRCLQRGGTVTTPFKASLGFYQPAGARRSTLQIMMMAGEESMLCPFSTILMALTAWAVPADQLLEPQVWLEKRGALFIEGSKGGTRGNLEGWEISVPTLPLSP